MRSPRKSKSKSDSDSKQIVLLDLNAPAVDLPVPLSVYYPRSPVLRKSPRFAPSTEVVESSNASPRASKKRALVDPNSLRKSPRLGPSIDDAKSSNAAQKARTTRDFDPNHLRKSPRFAPSIEEVKSSDSSSRVTKIRTLVDPNSLRKSPRFAPSSEEVKSSDSTPRLGKIQALVDPNSLRKSPRFAPSSEEVKLGDSTPKVSTIQALVDPNSLRKSPRFAPSPEEGKSSDATPRLSKIQALVDPKSLRRSPRLVPSVEEVKPSDSSSKTSKTQALMDPNSMRRSTRSSSNLGEAKPRDSSPKRSKTKALVEPNSLRRSSRLGPSVEEVKSSDSTPKTSKIQPLVDQNSLRRSLRLGPSPNELIESNVGKRQPLEAPSHGPRRSPRISGAGVGDAEPIPRTAVDSPELSREAEKAKKVPVTRGSKMLEEKSTRFSPADHGGEKSSADAKDWRSNAQHLTTIDDKEETNTNVDCLNEKCVRRSNRSTSTNVETKSSCLKGVAEKVLPKKLHSPKRTFSELESSKPLSPRVRISQEEDGDTGPMMVNKFKPDFSREKHLKGASKLISVVADNISEVIKKVITEITNEIDMRPSTFSSALATDESTKLNTSDKLSNSLDECPSKSIWSSSRNMEQMSLVDDQAESNLINSPESYDEQPPKKIKSSNSSRKKRMEKSDSCFFVGDPIPDNEAQERWRWRYELKNQRFKGQSMKLNDDDEDEIILDVECHFAQANITNCIFSLGDCAYIKGDGKKKHVGRIVEFFKTTNGEKYFRVQWFYPVEDTVIQQEGAFHDKRRLFYSTIMNDNLIDCIISKVHVTKITPRVGQKISSISPSDLYYDMEYCVDYSTFRSLEPDNSTKSHDLGSTCGINTVHTIATETYHAELALLDLYSGCGGMSTGLQLGTKIAGVDLVTRWALDCEKSACESLKLNHPETNVRNETAEDFLELLKEWEKLCKRYRSSNIEKSHPSRSKPSEEAKSDDEDSGEEIEVSRLIDICYGDPNKTGKRRLNFKVRWKGYDSSEDTWEPVEGLSNCREKIEDFVRNGMKTKILPLPTDVDVICGGPPCQGISGYNRFRNVDSPLDDERNRQIVVFMDIVNFLKPKYVLMENVVDILRFDKGSLGRYALSRLVHMRYQARLGTIAAGCYGLPQFRLRVFLWGALPHENLPQFPLPTHDVVVRYWPPPEFERNTVAYNEDQPRELENALFLQDAISDLPPVTNDETRDNISYEKPSETEFQRYIRSTKAEMVGSAIDGTEETKCSLYDHRAYPLFEDDYIRVCKIPKRKGANFRDLPGVVVGSDNVARRDPNEEIILLPSGKPLVPDYAFTFEQGKSKRPFSRLWWDETVPTVLTFPSCHSQASLHPEQDRVLTIREYARLQGFPDYYRFCGTVRERYCQVGNAVPVNVSRALGYSLGMAFRKLSSNEPLLTLPRKFSLSSYSQFSSTQSSQDCLELGC